MTTLAILRQEKCLKQSEVAKRLGITTAAYSNIETLKRKPSYDVLCALEDLFDKSHRELLSQAEDSA